MKKILLPNLIATLMVAAVILAGILLVSCSKNNTEPATPKHVLKEACAATVYTLWAGQSINAGYLSVSNDLENLYIEYTITDPAQAMVEIHLWAGLDINLCPHTTPGNPKPGLFPYFANATTSTPAGNLLTDPMYYSLTIPLLDINAVPGDLIFVAAHAKAAVQTLWSEDIPFPGNNWATYSGYTVCDGGAK